MNEINQRFKYLREAIGFYIRLLLCQIGAEVIVLMAAGAAVLPPDMDQTEMLRIMLEMLSQNSYRMIVFTYLLLAFSLWWTWRKNKGKPLVLSAGLDRPIRSGELLWGVVMGAGGCLWAAILMELLGGAAMPFEAYVNRSIEVVAQSAEPMWLQFVAIVLFSAFFEEYVFRGLIFSRFRAIMSPMSALLCQAFVYGSMYTGGAASVHAMIMGTIMGLAVMKTDSLRGAVAVHMGFSLMSFLANPMYDVIFASTDTTKMIFAASAAAFALGAVLFFHSGTKKNDGKSK